MSRCHANGNCIASFCGKDRTEVFLLVFGPQNCICDECVATAAEVIARRKAEIGVTAVIGRVFST